MNFVRTVTVLCLLLPNITSQEFDLRIVGTINPNLLTLECRIRQTETSEPNAFFWLNGTSLFDVVPRVQINREEGSRNIIFIITRDLEGIYTCGTQSNPNNQRESDPKFYPAFPVYEDLMGVPTVFPVASGTKARLRCAIQPGKLIGFYTVEWSNVKTGLMISLRGGHTSGSDNSNSGHYSIDREDLSLIISDVSPADAGDYVCVLGVEGGDRAVAEMVYEQTRSVNLSLVVFDLPRIPQPPTPQVVTLQNNDILATNEDSVIFTCTATATEPFASSLEIFWWHGDVRDVQTIGSDRYSTAVTGRSTSNGVTTSITAEMTIRSTGVIDNGVVRCEARIPPSEASGSVPATTFANTTLAILGGFSGMTVSVTQEGNIFFDIKLHDIIPIDVNLYIEYTPLNNPTSTIRMITKDGFINTRNIIYLERDPPQAILDTEFTLKVALITQNLEMGPKSDVSQSLDTRRRPLSTKQLYEIIITVSVIGCFVFLLLFILLIVIACLVKKRFKRKDDMIAATRVALEVLPREVERHPDASPADLLADVIPKIYTRIHQTDHGGAEGAIQQQEQLQLSEEEIAKAIESIKEIVNTGLFHPQLKPRIFKLFQEDIFYRTMTSVDTQDHQFLITAFKKAYSVLYEDVIDASPSWEEDLDNVVQFLEDTLEGLLTVEHKFQLKEDLLSRLNPKTRN